MRPGRVFPRETQPGFPSWEGAMVSYGPLHAPRTSNRADTVIVRAVRTRPRPRRLCASPRGGAQVLTKSRRRPSCPVHRRLLLRRRAAGRTAGATTPRNVRRSVCVRRQRDVELEPGRSLTSRSRRPGSMTICRDCGPNRSSVSHIGRGIETTGLEFPRNSQTFAPPASSCLPSGAPWSRPVCGQSIANRRASAEPPP